MILASQQRMYGSVTLNLSFIFELRFLSGQVWSFEFNRNPERATRDGSTRARNAQL